MRRATIFRLIPKLGVVSEVKIRFQIKSLFYIAAQFVYLPGSFSKHQQSGASVLFSANFKLKNFFFDVFLIYGPPVDLLRENRFFFFFLSTSNFFAAKKICLCCPKAGSNVARQIKSLSISLTESAAV